MEFSQEKILEGLNDEQIAAVMHDQGPLLIIAGAGTGKTKVITHRIAYLIAAHKARPEEIVALTFTDKAAAEMEERVDILLPYGFANVLISTFHAFGDHILREHALELGLTPDFQVLSRPEQVIFFRQHLFDFPLSHYRPLSEPTRFIDAMINLISRAKDEDTAPEDYLAYAYDLQKKASEENPQDEELAEEAGKQMEIARTYQLYQEFLAKEGKVDFGDQVNLVLKLFRERPRILQRIQKQLKYILVDEFQDTNYAQFQLVKLLGQSHQNITVVGDDDQSIYKFRGAAISNILNFMDTYPHAKQIVLTQNYRSTQAILDTAYRLISYNNPDRLEVKNNVEKRLVGITFGGKAVEHLHYDTLSSESDAVAKMIEEMVTSGRYQYKDVAILVRSNADADPFIRSLNQHEIPHCFSGGRGLYNREEIRLLIAFLRVVADFNDSLSLYHLASSEIYELNMKDLTRCLNVAKYQHRSLYEIFENSNKTPELEQISLESRATIEKLMSDIHKYLELSRDNPTGIVLYNFLTESGYLNKLTREKSAEAGVKIQNMAKFFDIIKNFGDLVPHDRVPQFVDHLQLLIEAGDDPTAAEIDRELDAVNVLTVHKAKGLEFPVVFLVCLVQNKFPHTQRREPIELPQPLIKDVLPTGDFHLQEERRLFYVGMTRAQKELYLTSSRDHGGVRPRKVSQFVLEAMDKPRADEDFLRTTPLEAIRRYQPLTKSMRASLAPIPQDQIISLSYGQIDDYLTCPLKYKYVHVLRVPIMPHHTVVFGYALHVAIGEYHRRKKNQQPITVEDLIKIFEEAWRREGFLSREHEEQRLSAGREALERFFEQQEKADIIPYYVEEEFSFIQGTNRVVGRWDRVDIRDDKIYIIDFKSSQIRQQKKADEQAQKSLQMAIYALAFYRTFHRIPHQVVLHFLESGLVGAAPVSVDDFAKTEEKIAEAAAGIRSRNYTAKPDYMACRYCAYAGVCPSTESG